MTTGPFRRFIVICLAAAVAAILVDPAAADQYSEDVAALAATGFDPTPYQASGEGGDPDALYRLAIIEEEGNADYGASLALFEQAAGAGHAGALFWMGRYHLYGTGDRIAALEMLQAAADAGHADAPALLAQFAGASSPVADAVPGAPADTPVSVADAASATPPATVPVQAAAPVATRSMSAAEQYVRDVSDMAAAGFDPAPYQAAAEAGDPNALYRLAIIAEDGNFDSEASLPLFERAAAVGHPIARFWLGRYHFYAGDHVAARLLLGDLAAAGYPDAIAMLAQLGGAADTPAAPTDVETAAATATPAETTPDVAPVAPTPETTVAPCLDPLTVDDGDVIAAAGAIAAAGLCVRQDTVEDGGLTWTFTVIEDTRRPDGPFWFLPHDDEDSAFQAALHNVQTRGGRLIAVEARDSRIFRGQDPNRNFGRTAAEQCAQQQAPAPRYTDYVMAQLADAPVAYLALHTNDDGYSGDGRGGSGTISVLRRSSVLRGLPAENPPNAGFADDDSVVLLAGPGELEANPSIQQTQAMVNAAGMNVIYERVTREGNDCSLSNYIVLNANDKPYTNIEVQHGQTDTQIAMIDALLPLIGFVPAGGTEIESPSADREAGIVPPAPIVLAASPYRPSLAIGIGDYDSLPDVATAEADAGAIKQALASLGNDARLALVGSRAMLDASIGDSVSSIHAGDQYILYFSGHSLAIDGETYLLPADAPIPEAGDISPVRDIAISVSELVERIREKEPGIAMIVLDASRENPIAAMSFEGVDVQAGPAPLPAGEGVVMLFAAGFGQMSLDRLGEDDPDPNSVFARALVPLLAAPGLSHVDMVKIVQAEVRRLAATASHEQLPAYHDRVVGEVILLPSEAQRALATVAE